MQFLHDSLVKRRIGRTTVPGSCWHGLHDVSSFMLKSRTTVSTTAITISTIMKPRHVTQGLWKIQWGGMRMRNCLSQASIVISNTKYVQVSSIEANFEFIRGKLAGNTTGWTCIRESSGQQSLCYTIDTDEAWPISGVSLEWNEFLSWVVDMCGHTS